MGIIVVVDDVLFVEAAKVDYDAGPSSGLSSVSVYRKRRGKDESSAFKRSSERKRATPLLSRDGLLVETKMRFR